MRKLNIFVLSTSMMFAFSQMLIGAANVPKPTGPTFEIRIPGKFSIYDGTIAIEKINEIRRSAYESGHFNLNIKDYKPLEWNDSLTEVAKRRAMEASIYSRHGDMDNSVVPYGEILAWNPGARLEGGLHSWKGEIETYTKNRDLYDSLIKTGEIAKNAAVGHYYALADPTNKYIGVAGFSADPEISTNGGTVQGEGNHWGAVAGIFTGHNVDTNLAKRFSNLSRFRVATSGVEGLTVSNLSLELPAVLGVDKTAPIVATVNIYSDENKVNTVAPVVFKKKEWESNDTNIISIDDKGNLVAHKKGTAEITLRLDDNLIARKSVEVKEGEISINEMYPKLIPIKKEAGEKLEKLQSFNEEVRDKFKKEIDQASSNDEIRGIVRKAEKENEIASILVKAKNEVDFKLQMYYFSAGKSEFLGTAEAGEIFEKLRNAPSITELNKIYKEVTGSVLIEDNPELDNNTTDNIVDEAIIEIEDDNKSTPPSTDTGEVSGGGISSDAGKTETPEAKPEKDNQPSTDISGQPKEPEAEKPKDSIDKEPEIAPSDKTTGGGESTPETGTVVDPGKSEDKKVDETSTPDSEKSKEAVEEGKDKEGETTDKGKIESKEEETGSEVTPEKPTEDKKVDETPTPDSEKSKEAVEEEKKVEEKEEIPTQPVADPEIEKAQIEARKAAFEKDVERIYNKRKNVVISKLLLQQQFEVENGRLNKLNSKSDTGIWATLDNNQLKHKNDSVNTNGVTVGYDAKLGNNTVGVLGSYGAGKVKSKSIDEKNETFTAGVYGIHRVGNFYGGALVDYQSTKVKGMKRFIGGNVTLQSGYTFKLKNNISVSPQLDFGFGSIKSKEIDKTLTSRSAGTTLNINYTPTSVLKFGASLGAHRVRFSNANVQNIEVVDADKFIYEINDERLGSKIDTHYNANVNIGAQITPLFSVEGNVGYSKYEKSKLSGVSYGVQVNYKF